jgi:hypothetical protein
MCRLQGPWQVREVGNNAVGAGEGEDAEQGGRGMTSSSSPPSATARFWADNSAFTPDESQNRVLVI